MLLTPPLNSVATLSTAQTTHVCRPGVASSADDRQRPSPSASDHKTADKVTYITLLVNGKAVADQGHAGAGGGLSPRGRMLDSMSKSKRRPGQSVKQTSPGLRHETPSGPTGPAPRVSRLTPPQVLERIERARAARDKAEAELAVLIDHAVNLGIGWPESIQCSATRVCSST